MKLLALCVLALAVLTNGERVSYEGYSVQRITPMSDDQVQALRNLESLGVSVF